MREHTPRGEQLGQSLSNTLTVGAGTVPARGRLVSVPGLQPQGYLQ